MSLPDNCDRDVQQTANCLHDNVRKSESPNNSDSEPKEQMRLHLFMARCGVASRRASEKIIEEGRVTVNGKTITTPGQKVLPEDEVCVDGEKIFLQTQKRYVLLNKPAGYVCSSSDEKGRDTALDLLTPHFSERLYNVGRLDMYSDGLIIFTNDGDFAAKVSHPSNQTEKEYEVETAIGIPGELIQKFAKGIRVDGVFYKALKAEKLDTCLARFTLIEGKNREIRRVFEHFGLGIKRLTRIRIGKIQLTPGFKAGSFRELKESEVAALVNQYKEY